MRWIWQNYSEKTDYILNPYYSPFNEAYVTDSGEVKTNVFVRFEKIFKDLRTVLSDPGLFNVTVHFLAHQDMLNGLDYEETVCCILETEMKKGEFGEEVKQLINSDCLDSYEKKYIIKMFYEYKMSNEIKSLFDEVFTYIFRNSAFEEMTENYFLMLSMSGYVSDVLNQIGYYKSGDTEKNINNSSSVIYKKKIEPEIYYRACNNTTYYYCGKKTEQKENKFRLIKCLFADVTDKKEAVWDKCIGVIGAEEDECAYPVIGEVQII